MTPTLAFKDWFYEKHPDHESYHVAKAAWLEATRQAYEACAKIADEAEIKMLKKLLSEQGISESLINENLKGCKTDSGEAIRQRLKEYDNEET